ncbi:hypothetical protein RDI58_010921 [Solanum bulbocastanum]|uniref:NB-ARC domain-containing protein n=1 Tax=Solanum bulbocastanum TaxID=147425 RepID=A0AAN8TQ63_SOLBU
MSDYKILRQVCGHLRDFYHILLANKTSTDYLYPWFHLTADRVTQFCFNHWTGKYERGIDYYYKKYEVSQCSSEITSLLIDIMPLELEVLYICTSKLMKKSRCIAVSYAPTQSINVYSDIPKRSIHRAKLNDMLAHVGVLTRKISILVSELMEESSENNINKADFSAPYMLQEIEQMKEDIKQLFLKATESSQIRFPMDDGLLFMNLLLRHLNDLLISNAYSVALIKKETGMVKESLEFLRSSFGKNMSLIPFLSEIMLSRISYSLPSVTDKTKRIVAEVTNLQLEDKNGDDPLDAKSSDELIESTSSSFVEVTVGHEEDETWTKIDVISIVGMPGVILQGIAESSEGDKVVDLAEKVQQELYNKRYFIILDDVWDIATVEMSIACFPRVERGNRIILTSRNSKVGLQLICCSDLLYLQLLTLENSWDLFEKRVFGDQGSCPAELLEVGYQIVDKSQGLPLAVVLIAGVIVRGKKKEKDLWLKIQHNMDSVISVNNNLQMMKVMQLSYDHLPYHLKPLLLYFGRSQKNKRTSVSKLMQLWMAEGSLVMVDRSMSKSSRPFSVAIKVCYVHDVVHDFCSVKAKKEEFFKLINSDAPFHASDFIHRHLTIHTDDSQLHKRCALFNSNKCSAGSKHLISLKVKNWLDPFSHIRHFGLVRVLQLGNIILERVFNGRNRLPISFEVLEVSDLCKLSPAVVVEPPES